MKQFISNIENLLESHDFVTIPGFGGFVAESEGASKQGDLLYPPHKALVFNPALTYNDGLLAHEYVRTMGISYEKASLMIAEAVNEINRGLISSGHVSFGNLGNFATRNGSIIFEGSKIGGPLASAFGLDSVYFPEIEHKAVAAPVADVAPVAAENAAVMPKPAHAAQTSGKPVKQNSAYMHDLDKEKAVNRLLYIAAVVLLIIVLFPVRIQEGNFANYASIVPPIVNVEKTSETVEPDCTPYYMIVASFKTKARAEKFVSTLPDELKSRSNIIYSEKRFRISLESFASEEQGEAYIAQFIESYPAYYDAWILTYNP